MYQTEKQKVLGDMQIRQSQVIEPSIQSKQTDSTNFVQTNPVVENQGRIEIADINTPSLQSSQDPERAHNNGLRVNKMSKKRQMIENMKNLRQNEEPSSNALIDEVGNRSSQAVTNGQT